MRLVRGALRAWRDSFDCGGRSVAMWFPGHMAKGLRQMKGKLQKVDCLVEVHDARIPFSGRNPVFQEALGVRPHLLLLNKMDLADLKEKSRILEQLKQEGLKNVIFTDCEREENIKENVEYCIMVIGVPNVGKSSLINALRRLHLKKGKASQVGGEPGITKAVLTKIQVSERPVMYLIDTPGVLSPRIGSVETGLKLALCGTIRDYLVGEDVMADYLLYNLNKHQLFKYVERYGLDAPCDDIESVLKRVALKLGKTRKVKVLTGTGDVNVIAPDYNAAGYEFVRTFRKGELGKVMLD
ncbi:mitochondrial ribosome-associated GTPase 1 isoform X3 [Alligator mississippiensis]|uniref:mitochondrial ribosome-associated GTPase 1 isoform X3 n=1 Tax=Alligator mississippiensis TaxID=8496 RepID=UPI0028775C77|nr:mitochondrial ribosome-associated GTPase 1 isoform X3 [Alligator mississippiensis]